MEKISVIVPVYNVEAYLERCVRSLMGQTYANLEILLVDDGSKDNSGTLCDELAREDDRIRVIHKENGGLSSARNAGIDAATGDYFAFVDSDDWIEPSAYQWMMETAKKFDAPMVCAGRYDVDGDTGEKTVGLCPEKEEVISGAELAGRIFTWDHLDSAAWDKLYRAELFRAMRYPVGRINEDIPVTYRLGLLAGKVALCPKPVYNYYQRQGSITISAFSEKRFHFPRNTAEVYDYVIKNYPEIGDKARYLRARSLAYTLQAMEIDEGDAPAKYPEEYQQLKGQLREHVGFICTSSLFSSREKRDYLMIATGIYRGLRRVYHRVKGG